MSAQFGRYGGSPEAGGESFFAEGALNGVEGRLGRESPTPALSRRERGRRAEPAVRVDDSGREPVLGAQLPVASRRGFLCERSGLALDDAGKTSFGKEVVPRAPF